MFDGKVVLLEHLLVSMAHTKDGSCFCGHICILEQVENEFGHNISVISVSASSQGRAALSEKPQALDLNKLGKSPGSVDVSCQRSKEKHCKTCFLSFCSGWHLYI